MTIDLWMEGFAATGQYGQAQKLGIYEADTLDKAVEAWVAEDPNRADYMSGTKSYWGCRFFDNEEDARKTFG